jgi:peptide/nickel transport system substrate-binding protein
MTSRRKICDQIQLYAFETVPFIPTGQSFLPTGFRDDLSGFAKTPYPMFWGVKRG